MAREGDNDNDEYYVTIQTRLGRRIVNPNRFVQAAAIALGILTCLCIAFLQISQASHNNIRDTFPKSIGQQFFFLYQIVEVSFEVSRVLVNCFAQILFNCFARV